MRCVGVCLLTALTLLGSTGGALAVPLTTALPDAAASPSGPARTAPGTAEVREPQFLRLDIEEVTPSTVTTTSPRTVTVTGSVENIGDRRVEDVSVRLQRGPAVSTSEALRTSLTLDQSRFDTVGLFENVATDLDRGESATFSLSMPLQSVAEPSLNITDPGVYPLLVNVNGTPDYGGAARLDDARFLLPVLGVPGSGPDAPPVPPDTTSPVALTMLWPLADEPRLAAGLPGSVTEQVRLVDDDLSRSLDSGGRLDGLLGALEYATRDGTDRGRSVRDSTCIAVDPDLLITVTNMTRGYLVVDDPTEPAGAARPGAGEDAASAWLDRLRALASTTCVTAVPFAQVDLGAVASIGDPALSASALTAPADLVDRILGIESVRGFVWTDSGILSPAAAEMVRAQGPATALVAHNTVDDPVSGEFARLAPPEPTGGQLDALLFDPAVGAAFAAVGATPQTPSYTPQDARYDLTEDSRTARLQDALGAMTWAAVEPDRDTAPDSLLVVPPQLWTADADEAEALLATTTTLLRSGLATARPFTEILGRQPGSPRPTTLAAPQQAVADGVPEHVRAAAADQLPRIDSLTAALVDEPQAVLTPALFTSPLREDLLRAMSLAHRRDGLRGEAERAANTRVDEVATSLDDLFGAVTVVSPGGVYTLASEQGPLPLVARNDLPIGVRVRLHVQAPAEVIIDDIGPTQLPPRGSRTLTVPTEIADSRKLVVQFSLASEDGRQFGEPTSVTVRSNAYGQVLAILTAGAGALLLFLAGRRLWHRFRGQPDRADEGYERS
ncbi:glycoprotein [Rhodococcus triatomae]|nr:glycoprotein [Rhodococcus triatomae]QNG25667.1 glycoprotein [Rhodococcus triatomae]